MNPPPPAVNGVVGHHHGGPQGPGGRFPSQPDIPAGFDQGYYQNVGGGHNGHTAPQLQQHMPLRWDKSSHSSFQYSTSMSIVIAFSNLLSLASAIRVTLRTFWITQTDLSEEKPYLHSCLALTGNWTTFSLILFKILSNQWRQPMTLWWVAQYFWNHFYHLMSNEHFNLFRSKLECIFLAYFVNWTAFFIHTFSTFYFSCVLWLALGATVQLFLSWPWLL